MLKLCIKVPSLIKQDYKAIYIINPSYIWKNNKIVPKLYMNLPAKLNKIIKLYK